MRVITGEARGRKLLEPKGMDIRPTTEKVKEALFNILQMKVDGCRFLDLFAGTGQIGIEAISRGADEAVFIDSSFEAVKLIKRNLEIMHFSERAKVLRADSLSFLKSGEKFDIVFADPPFDSELLGYSLSLITEFDILNENGIIICESGSEKTIPVVDNQICIRKDYFYGKIKLSVFTKIL